MVDASAADYLVGLYFPVCFVSKQFVATACVSVHDADYVFIERRNRLPRLGHRRRLCFETHRSLLVQSRRDRAPRQRLHPSRHPPALRPDDPPEALHENPAARVDAPPPLGGLDQHPPQVAARRVPDFQLDPFWVRRLLHRVAAVCVAAVRGYAPARDKSQHRDGVHGADGAGHRGAEKVPSLERQLGTIQYLSNERRDHCFPAKRAVYREGLTHSSNRIH
mmetsp:Transcript_16771/g.43185  ORF Transcript_16771/g.43185 Transcript_16771/m.43185 type:complete len:221 (+) Transcript_16771:1018-1680(+)